MESREGAPPLVNDLLAISRMRQALALADDPLHHYTPAEARAVLHEAGISAETAGRILDVSGRSVQSWLSGEHAPRGPQADNWQRLVSLLARANALRAGRLAEGVQRLLEVVRSTPVPAVEVAA